MRVVLGGHTYSPGNQGAKENSDADEGESRTWGASGLPRGEHTRMDAQDHGCTKHSEKVPSKGQV